MTWDSVCDPRVHGVASLELQLGFAPRPLAWLEVTPLSNKHGEPGMLWLGADGHKTLRHCLGTSPYTVTQTVTLAIAACTQHRTPEPYRCDIWIPSTHKKKQHGSIVIFFFFKPPIQLDRCFTQCSLNIIFLNLKKQKSEKAIQQNAEVSSALPCPCSDAAFADVATLISGPAAGPFHADKGRASLRRYSSLNGYISCLQKKGKT